MKKTKSANNNQTTIRQFIKSQVKTPKELTYETGEEGVVLKFKVYPVVTFAKRTEAVRTIIELVLAQDATSIFDYSPEYLSLARKYAIVGLYTDLKMPTDIDDNWLIVNYTSLYNDIVEYVGQHDIDAIFMEADQGIEARKQYLSHRTDLNKLISSATDKLGEITTQFSQEDMARVLEALKNLPNFSSDEMAKAVMRVQNQGQNKD